MRTGSEAQGQRMAAVQHEPGTASVRGTVLVWCSWIAVSGGMERVAASIANGLRQKGWRVIFVGPCNDVPSFKRHLDDGITVIHHKTQNTMGASFKTGRILNRIVKEHSVDLVSAHGSVLPLIGCRVPVVWTEHEIRYGSGEMLSGVKGLIWRVIRRNVQTGRWNLIGVSRYLLDQTCQKLRVDASLGSVIYNGIAEAQTLRRLPAPGLKPPYRIGYLGRLISYKGPLDIFTLMAELDSMGVPHEWHVFGDGDLLPEMRERAKAVADRVHVHGPVLGASEALAQVDLIAFLSRGEYEGLGLVLLEARLARRLIVAWNAGCIPEAAGEHAALVEPFDLRQFAEGIAAELRRGRTPPALGPEECSVQAMVDQYDAVYVQVLERSAGGRRSSAS